LAYFEVWEMAIHSDVFAASHPWEVFKDKAQTALFKDPTRTAQ
jgi:hypothetical protein